MSSAAIGAATTTYYSALPSEHISGLGHSMYIAECKSAENKPHITIWEPEKVIHAAEEVLKATKGVAFLITSDTQKNGCPQGRPVRICKTPESALSEEEKANAGMWCDRLWIPTNVYSEKVAQLNVNPKCSIAAYDEGGNYFIMQGEVSQQIHEVKHAKN